MIQIRQNVFETNSSSSHSLVIRTDDLMNELEEDIYFTHDEMLDSMHLDVKGRFGSEFAQWDYGRSPFRIIYYFDDRVRYAYANFSFDEGKKEELITTVKKLVPECACIIKPDSCEADEDYVSCWLTKYNISLEEFLTNKNYIIIQDGDEYNYWTNLVNAGIIDTACMENGEEYEQV